MALPAGQGVVGHGMRSPLRVLLAVAAVLAAAQPATARPSAYTGLAVYRTFDLETGRGFGRTDVSLDHVRAATSTGTASGAVSGDDVNACVFGWTKSTFFSECGEPSAVTFEAQPGSATGRLAFTLRDSWRDGVAVVDLTLADPGGTPVLAYDLAPYATSVAPRASAGRVLRATGTVRVTNKVRGRTESTTFRISDVPVSVREGLLARLAAYPGVTAP